MADLDLKLNKPLGQIELDQLDLNDPRIQDALGKMSDGDQLLIKAASSLDAANNPFANLMKGFLTGAGIKRGLDRAEAEKTLKAAAAAAGAEVAEQKRKAVIAQNQSKIMKSNQEVIDIFTRELEATPDENKSAKINQFFQTNGAGSQLRQGHAGLFGFEPTNYSVGSKGEVFALGPNGQSAMVTDNFRKFASTNTQAEGSLTLVDVQTAEGQTMQAQRDAQGRLFQLQRDEQGRLQSFNEPFERVVPLAQRVEQLTGELPKATRSKQITAATEQIAQSDALAAVLDRTASLIKETPGAVGITAQVTNALEGIGFNINEAATALSGDNSAVADLAKQVSAVASPEEQSLFNRAYEEAARGKTGKNASSLALLETSIGFLRAKAEAPGDRITDQDFARFKINLTGATTNPEIAINQIEELATISRIRSNEAKRILRQLGVNEQSVPSADQEVIDFGSLPE